MKRRTLLQSIGTLPLWSSGWAALLAPANAARAQARKRLARVRPADPLWPSAERWQQLRDAVGGNLIPVQALFAPCETDPKGAACLDTLKNIRNPYWIGDQPAGTQVSGWLDAWTPAPSVYAVRARNASD